MRPSEDVQARDIENRIGLFTSVFKERNRQDIYRLNDDLLLTQYMPNGVVAAFEHILRPPMKPDSTAREQIESELDKWAIQILKEFA